MSYHKLINTVSLHSEEAFTHYINKNKDLVKGPNKITKKYLKYTKMVTAIWKAAAELMVESENGLYVDKLGYFAFVMNPYTRIPRIGVDQTYKRYVNYHTDHHAYSPVFFPFRREVRNLLMDKCFSRKITRPFAAALKSGKKYKFHLSAMKKIYKRKK